MLCEIDKNQRTQENNNSSTIQEHHLQPTTSHQISTNEMASAFGDNKEESKASDKREQLQPAVSYQGSKAEMASAFGDNKEETKASDKREQLQPKVSYQEPKAETASAFGDNKEESNASDKREQLQPTVSYQESKTKMASAFGDNKVQNKTSSRQEQQLQPTAFCQESQTFAYSEICDLILDPSTPVPFREDSRASIERNVMSKTEQQLQPPVFYQESTTSAFGEIYDFGLSSFIPATESIASGELKVSRSDNMEQSITSTTTEKQLQPTASFQESKTSAFSEILEFELAPFIPDSLRESIGEMGTREQNTTSTKPEQLQQRASYEESKTEVASAFGVICDPIWAPSIRVLHRRRKKRATKRQKVSSSDNKEQNIIPTSTEQQLQPTAPFQESKTSAFREILDLELAPSPVPLREPREQNSASTTPEQQLQQRASYEEFKTEMASAFDEICDSGLGPSIPVLTRRKKSRAAREQNVSSSDNEEQNVTSKIPEQLQSTSSFQESKTSTFGEIHDFVLEPSIPVPLIESIGEIGNSEQNTTSTSPEHQLQQTVSYAEFETKIASAFAEICDPILAPSIPVTPRRKEFIAREQKVSSSDDKEQNITSTTPEQQLQPTVSFQESKTSAFREIRDFVLEPYIPVPFIESIGEIGNREQNTTSTTPEQQRQRTASYKESKTEIASAFGEIFDPVLAPSIPVNPIEESTSRGKVTSNDNQEQNIPSCNPEQQLQPTASHQNSETAFGEICDLVLAPSIPVPPSEESTSSEKVKKRGLWNCCACIRKKPNLASYAHPYGTWQRIKMASDNKAGSISRSVQKHAGRAKERILQNLGKADRTTDDILNIYISNFNKQHASAQRLSKEFKNYVSCARAMQAASKSLMDTLTDTYEQNWTGCDQLPAKTQVLEMVWDDFCHKLNDQVGVPIATYLSQFPEIRGKIAKRGRKLVDYDKCRHNLQSLQQPSRKREEMKIGKAKERLDEARKLYEVINNELHDELPALYDSRISFLATNLQTMFVSENQFHNENAKVYNQFTDIVENLAMENQKGKYRFRKPGSPLILKGDGDTRHYEEIEFKRNQGRISGQNLSNGEIISSNTLNRSDPKMREINLTVSQANTMNENSNLDQLRLPRKMEKDYEPVEVNEMNQSDSQMQKMDELYDIPVGATTTDLPAGVLYRVRATYKYTGEDVDELSFEIGDIIQVVEYDDPEEQEEGWLMGTKESTGDKGLFPANFTRPI